MQYLIFNDSGKGEEELVGLLRLLPAHDLTGLHLLSNIKETVWLNFQGRSLAKASILRDNLNLNIDFQRIRQYYVSILTSYKVCFQVSLRI